jgi:ribose transport system ATP-binding protein
VTAPPRLEVRKITKRFAGVTALKDVSVSFAAGEVHAVIGENGAGKSTLMKVLAGVQTQDAGEVWFEGRQVEIDSVQTALNLGISLIHQELNLATNLDVGANIFLGREPRRYGLIDFKAIRTDAVKYLQMVGLELDPTTIVGELTIGVQQRVEIAKALSVNSRVLIMDEPTSSLSPHESEALFDVIAKLRENGVTVIYISHRLAEIERIADRVTVLRDGQNAGMLDREQISHDAMVERMVGRDISQYYARAEHEVGQPVLAVQNLRTRAWPAHPVNFQVGAGEMVGVAGLVGAGRTEMLAAIFGIEPPLSGQVIVDDQTVTLKSCRDAIEAGMAMVPEDRKHQGLILEMGIRTNIGLPGLGRHQFAGGFLNRGQERRDSDQMIAQLRIKTPHDMQQTQYLSGGNQQKVLLLDEPTRGVDIGAKHEIYRLMEELAERGVAILFVSSEMEEVISMSDRVIVMHEGRIAGELTRDEISEAAIMQLATGTTLIKNKQ